jgi:dihydroorotase
LGSDLQGETHDQVIDANGRYLFPGIIDDQVHFREPGLTHKATIFTESRAAVSGGITSFMEMPNTIPPAFTHELLEKKYEIASRNSLANYSFYIGTSHDNLSEILKTDTRKVCGLKIFMGSSTGNLLVDDPKVLEDIFSQVPFLIAAHCEDEQTIKQNSAQFKEKYGDDFLTRYHSLIRSAEACYKSSSFAASLARKHGTRLHILHISTAKEISLFDSAIPLEKKKLTAEACIHHLWFNDTDYEEKGTLIKWNPAIKTARDQEAIFQALVDTKIDVIATDHAPHTLEEKGKTYFDAPSGGPLVQHSLVTMLEFVHRKQVSLDWVAEKMCHNPAILFRVSGRGFIREGYFADLVLVNLNDPWTVASENIFAKCGWSPFEGKTFKSRITHTFVSGHLAYCEGEFDEKMTGLRLEFDAH